MQNTPKKEGAPVQVWELRAEGNVIHTLRTHQRSDADKAHCIAQYILKKEGADVDAALLDETARNAPMTPLQLEITPDAETRGAAQPKGLEGLSGRLADG